MHIPSFEDKEIHYAYTCMHNFFDHFDLSGALYNIDSILKSAGCNKIWERDTPCILLHYMQKLQQLCTAAFVIHYNSSIRPQAIVDEPENGQPDMSVKQHFIGRHIYHTVWNYFPRNLTAAQYHNPYKAIKKFCNYKAEQEWKKALTELTEYALSNSSINEVYPPYNILPLRQRLLQLIEACHLLKVRTSIKNQVTTVPKKEKNIKK